MKNEKAIVIGIVFALAMLAFVGCASAATIYVNPGELIQTAVNTAGPGDTIIVRDGTYTENVNVNKRLTITSENGSASTIVQAANLNIFYVTADYVTIRGFTVTGTNYSGIILHSVEGCHISKNICRSTGRGITLYSHSSNNTIKNNTCSSVYYCGIQLACSCSNNLLENNTCSESDVRGIEVIIFSNNNTLRNNTCSGNTETGILLDHCSNNTLEKNACSGSGKWGIRLHSSSNNVMYCNAFIENIHNVYSSDSTNIWNSPEEITYNYKGNTHTSYLGNYWSDYSGSDADGDGIGDTPYPIDTDADNYPLVEPFENYFEQPSPPPTPAKPVLTSPLKITPEKDTYYVGDTLTAEFTITNIGEVPIALDKLLLGGRFNDDKLPNGEYPDFTFNSVTLQPNVPYKYTGTLTLTYSGNYHFFIAYYIENPTPEEKALLDENNWNTCVDLGEGLTDEDRTEEISTAPGYAIIVAGQGIGKCGIDHAANNAYRTLRNLGFDDDHIFYFNSNQPQDIDGDGDNEVDEPALLNHFENAINQVKAEIGDNPTPLVFYITGHGLSDPDCFIFDEGNPSEGYLWVAKFQEELDKFSEGTPMLIVIGSCYSGRFITSNEGISAPNRIIITAAHDDQKRYLAGWGWFRASDQFWGDLNKGFDVKEAFVRRTWPADKRYLWLDDNGDSIGHPPDNLGNDGALATATTIGVAGTDDLELTSWYSVWIHSAGEVRVYDSQNRVTGLVNGDVKEEIPGSVYDEENEIVAIFSPSDTYRYEVVGTDEGTYGLTITSVEDGNTIAFTATDIPTSPNAIHQYTINWDALSQGKEGVTVQVDSDGDGVFEQTITADGELTYDEFMLQTATTIDFDPDTLNLQRKGKWVTTYTALPEGYDVSAINVSTVMLNDRVQAETDPTEIGDYDEDGIPDLMVKFDRQAVIDTLPVGNAVNVTVTGKLYDGTSFEGNDVIRVIDQG
ncbi:MAG: right-handed parallel beta-helix repeat-containing protein [Methanophagales archaeon]|nr:right-handed parallel beta-helix repeat-containing protein [Methanophagales archaeon]